MKNLSDFLSKYYIEDISECNIENIKTILEAENKKEEKKDAKKESNDLFFNTILFFTNERKAEKNKTLKNLEAAVKGKNIDIVTFVAKEVSFKGEDNKITIMDNKQKYVIYKQSNVDTIVIARLGAQDSEQCMECIKELQEWGLFVLNPIQAAKKASNKYTSAVLMERYDIPQPKFALLTANDIKDGQESLNEKLKDIYPKADFTKDESKKLEYVVKILDGHGGTGVFMVTGKTILSIIQAMFAIDPERELLLQKKEEGDGGDIRVHVLTSRTQQTILGAMKRQKIGGDFRSNVSLGAEAVKVDITEEQEEIAKKVAKISGMPWCAVDIMPLVKDSNPEIGDNVVLEYNASPGTDGISEVLGENFMELLLNAINDVNELVLQPKSIGFIENIKFTMPDDNEITMEAKLDTGNGAIASTIGCEKLSIDGDYINATIEGSEYKFKRHGQSNAKVGTHVDERVTVIIPCVQIGTRKLLNAEFALVDDRDKSTKVLLNRDLMSKMAYFVNPSRKHVIEDPLAVADANRRKK